MKRDFDFILDIFEGELGPKETILPYNPTLVKELGVKKGVVMIGRPMGMSCYWFLPRRCMLQWRHSGLVNAVTKQRDGSYKVRIEGLLIG